MNQYYMILFIVIKNHFNIILLIINFLLFCISLIFGYHLNNR